MWWKSACGHEWQAAINTRTELRHGCPKCMGHGSRASSHPSSRKRTSPRSTRA
ncbi:MAG: zinc-ribbon domain-containing protein [Myxococcales bacterium]